MMVECVAGYVCRWWLNVLQVMYADDGWMCCRLCMGVMVECVAGYVCSWCLNVLQNMYADDGWMCCRFCMGWWLNAQQEIVRTVRTAAVQRAIGEDHRGCNVCGEEEMTIGLRITTAFCYNFSSSNSMKLTQISTSGPRYSLPSNNSGAA